MEQHLQCLINKEKQKLCNETMASMSKVAQDKWSSEQRMRNLVGNVQDSKDGLSQKDLLIMARKLLRFTPFFK